MPGLMQLNEFKLRENGKKHAQEEEKGKKTTSIGRVKEKEIEYIHDHFVLSCVPVDKYREIGKHPMMTMIFNHFCR
jgi:hypothetical protein